jgi:hypothetical protein
MAPPAYPCDGTGKIQERIDSDGILKQLSGFVLAGAKPLLENARMILSGDQQDFTYPALHERTNGCIV